MYRLLQGKGLATVMPLYGSMQAWDSSSTRTFSPCVQAPAAATAALNNGLL
jgi:hypothetical protein